MEEQKEKQDVQEEKTADGVVTNQSGEEAEKQVAKDESKSVESFLNDEENKMSALKMAYQVFDIVEKNFQPDEVDGERSYKVSTLVKNSNLSYSKANNVLHTLEAFNLVKFTKPNTEFVFTFSKEVRVKMIEAELSAISVALSNTAKRYKAILGDEYSEERLRSFFKNPIC